MTFDEAMELRKLCKKYLPGDGLADENIALVDVVKNALHYQQCRIDRYREAIHLCLDPMTKGTIVAEKACNTVLEL